MSDQKAEPKEREWQNQAAPRKSLYEALQENREKRQEEYDQKFSERNTYHRLDSREVEHLENLRKHEKRRDEELNAQLARGLEKMKQHSSESKISYIPAKLKKSKIAKVKKSKSKPQTASSQPSKSQSPPSPPLASKSQSPLPQSSISQSSISQSSISQSSKPQASPQTSKPALPLIEYDDDDDDED